MRVEYIEDSEGAILSWYCTECGEELGADDERPGGEPEDGCHVCGGEIAWETWNIETDPSYPHRPIGITMIDPT